MMNERLPSGPARRRRSRRHPIGASGLRAIGSRIGIPGLVWIPGLALAASLAGPPRAAPANWPDMSGREGRAGGPQAESESEFRMHMLLRKSVFHVEVLTVDVRVDGETARRITRQADSRRYGKALADSLAAAAFSARMAWIDVCFRRSFGLDRMLDGIRKNLEGAPSTGMIDSATLGVISQRLATWYGFLEARGIRRGDRMELRVRGDTVRTIYRTGGGDILADRTDVDATERASVMGRYFALNSDFRDGLLRSLFPPGQR
ncbi:MAG: hypothetical protein ACE5HQ_04400 [Gemmatimonadota bacterium]